MNYAVVYYSQSGNTEKVARAIAEALPGQVVAQPLAEAGGIADADVVFVGGPLLQFTLPDPVRAYLAEKCAGRATAVFVTHAADEDMEMLAPWLQSCRQAAACCELVGFFHCQGRVPESVKQQWRESGVPMLEQFAELSASADGQPDERRLEAAREFAREVAVATV
jgi:hypothetical protein